MADSRIYETLTKDQRYRLKDIESYRKRKREYAKTPAEREKRRLYQKKWRDKNKEKYNEWAREYYRKNRHLWISKSREWNLKQAYGITLEQYDIMLKEQNGVCLICGCLPHQHGRSESSKVLHVDHNHDTGEIRGLLCSRCNGALGWYEKHSTNIKTYLKEVW